MEKISKEKKETHVISPAFEESPVAQIQPDPGMWKGRSLNFNSLLHDEMFYANSYILDWVD